MIISKVRNGIFQKGTFFSGHPVCGLVLVHIPSTEMEIAGNSNKTPWELDRPFTALQFKIKHK